MALFEKFENVWGQMVSKEKNSIIFGKKYTKHGEIIDVLGFSEGTTPFTYLGVPILKGRKIL